MAERAIRAVLFDMDGVLIDSEPTHRAAAQEALRERGLPVPDEDDWERVFLGRPDRDGFVDWFDEHRVSADIEALMAEKLVRVEALLADSVRPCDDGQWLARELHRHDVPLAVVTGARRAELAIVLKRFDLTDVFAATVSADDVTIGKPDPEPYLRGAAALGIDPAACLVIEDAVPGVRSAEAAGAAVIAVDRLARPERFAPLTPVDSLDEDVLATILGAMVSQA